MIAKVPENISAQYEAQSRAIDAAHWAAQHHAGLTCEEWEAASKVSAADFNVALAVRGPLLWHQCRLAKQLGTSSLHSLRDTHADHPMVIAARKAAHKLAKVTDADRAAYTRYREAMARPGRVRRGPLVQHARKLRKLFGTANVEKARAVFEARWNERFAELHAAA